MHLPLVPIESAERLLEPFGYWPSFHDAEVHEASLKRDDYRGSHPCAPSLTLRIHVFDSDGTLDDRGYYRIRTSVMATLRFNNIEDVTFHEFGIQNVLNDLQFEQMSDGRIGVALGPCFGLHGSLTCQSIEVVDVQPWSK